jgi:hypothetical protein
VAISRLKGGNQSAKLKGGNQPNWKVAISRIERWQSAEFKGGNQPNSKVAISRIQRVSQKTLQKCIPQISNIKKAYHELKIGPGHTDKSQILMKCNKPTNERQKECEKQKHQLTLITINRMVLKVDLSQDSDEICGISDRGFLIVLDPLKISLCELNG